MSIMGGKKATEPEVAQPPAGLSVIAVGVMVRGSIDSNGTVKVEGTVQGDIATRAQLLVAKGGLVEGDVEAKEAIVGGTVAGAIRAHDRVEIQPGAVVDGDVTTRRILVAEGASLNGQVRMGEGTGVEASEAGTSRSGASAPPADLSRTSEPVARVTVPPHNPSV